MIFKVFTVCVFLFVSISSFVHCTLWAPHNTVQEQVCRTEKCTKRGIEYFENLDPEVNPCDDFHSFVCGAWHVNNKAPEYMTQWTTQHVLESRLINDLKEILDKPANPSDRELTQVKLFYDSCMKRPFLGRLKPKDVGKHILTVGRLGQKKLWDIHQQYLLLTSESAFFGYFIHGFPKDDFVPMLLLQEVQSPYGAIFHHDWKVPEKYNYSHFLFLLMKSVGLPGTDAVIKEKIKKVIEFREKLNRICIESKKQMIEPFNPKTARGFHQWFTRKDPRGPKPLHAEMPWETIIKTLLSTAPTKFHDMGVTTMRNDDYFINLEKLLTSTSEEILVDNMEIYFAERHVIFTDDWKELIERTLIEPSKLLGAIRLDVPRHVKCIASINMWPQVGNVLLRKWFQKDIVPHVQEIISGLQLSMTSQLKESTWMDPPTQRKLSQKILEVKPWIGYPPWYNDLTKGNNPRLISAENDPLRADAYLDLEKFVMYIKSPLLKSPVFDPDLPKLYNLGGIAYHIGHEFYHLVEDCGIYYNAAGRPIQWWTYDIRTRCKKQRKCFVDAFNKETQRVFERTYNQKIQGGNPDSFHEDIPDVMGLDAAFRLFLVLKRRDKKICQTLPRFEKYSCEQMFFIAFGNSLCGRMTAKAARDQIETLPHSLDSVRVNGAVMHNTEFARAFQCPKGKPMNPEVKCNFWT